MVGKLLGGWVAKGYQSVQLKGINLRGMIFEDCEDEGNSRSGCLPDVLACQARLEPLEELQSVAVLH
jgi:hypothetical protein